MNLIIRKTQEGVMMDVFIQSQYNQYDDAVSQYVQYNMMIDQSVLKILIPVLRS